MNLEPLVPYLFAFGVFVFGFAFGNWYGEKSRRKLWRCDTTGQVINLHGYSEDQVLGVIHQALARQAMESRTPITIQYRNVEHG